MKVKLPPYLKEGMFEPQVQTWVVALVEQKVGVANDTRTITPEFVLTFLNERKHLS
jgi:hypothetical protein